MCSLYDLMSDDEIGDYFRANTAWRDGITPLASMSIYPGYTGRFVRLHEGQRVLDAGKWGYPTTKPRVRAPKEGQEPYVVSWWQNARELDKSLWKASVANPAQRCLVPFSRFSEPKAKADQTGPDDRNWWFDLPASPIGVFAGIWKDDPRFGRVYSFITTAPNPLIEPVHSKAMPAILHEEDFDRWLSEPWPAAQSLITAHPSQLMRLT